MDNQETGSKWWEYDSSDDTESTEKEYRKSVIDYLEENGHKGYALGNTIISGYVLMNACILDPQNDIPENIIMFAKNVNKYMAERNVTPLSNQDFSHSYNIDSQEYNLNLHVEGNDKSQTFEGTCNRNGDINSMKEVL